jgi:membrane-associated phospholipid phosphatase
MKEFIKDAKLFLMLYLLFLIAGGVLIIMFEKGDEILYFNQVHTRFFDEFFKWVTRLAEAPAYLLVLLFVFFYSYGKGLLLGINLLLTGGAVQFLKHVVFPDVNRPALVFQHKTILNFVEGVDVFHYHSFPSGHTAIGFAVCFLLSLFVRNSALKVFLFFIALLVGISRVYLLQHFFRDIYVGSLLGIVITTLIWLLIAQSVFYNRLRWKDRALLK